MKIKLVHPARKDIYAPIGFNIGCLLIGSFIPLLKGEFKIFVLNIIPNLFLLWFWNLYLALTYNKNFVLRKIEDGYLAETGEALPAWLSEKTKIKIENKSSLISKPDTIKNNLKEVGEKPQNKDGESGINMKTPKQYEEAGEKLRNSLPIREAIDKAMSLNKSGKIDEAQRLFGSAIRRNSGADGEFAQILKKMGLEEGGLLNGYYFNDPRFVAGKSDSSFRTAVFASLDKKSLKQLREINEIQLSYLKTPDLVSIWKFGLFGKIFGQWASENESEIESELPTYQQDVAEIVDRDWTLAVKVFEAGTALWEKSEGGLGKAYTELLISCFYCGICAATAFVETTSEEGIKTWVWAIGANRDSRRRIASFGISDKDVGAGEHMVMARRFAEEVLDVNFNAPAGTDPSEDAYLDEFDWDEVAQTILDEC